MLVELSRQDFIDMRPDQPAESMGNLNVFALTADGPIFWKKSFSDRVAKELRISSVSHTQEIEKTLRRGAVLVGETLPRHCHRRRRQIAFVLVGAAQDQPSRFLFAKSQQDVRRELVGRVLLPPEQRNIPHAEKSMACFMKEHVCQRAYQCVDRLDSCRSRLLGRILPNIVDVLVADGDAIFVGPGVGYPIASLGLQQESVSQTQRAQYGADFFQRLMLFQQSIDRLIVR